MRFRSRILHVFCSNSCKARLLRFTISVAVVTNIGASLWIMIKESTVPEYFGTDIHTSTQLSSQRRCYIPNLNPLEPEIKQLMSEPTPIKCPEAANPYFGKIAFETKKDLNTNYLVQKLDMDAPCCYRPFYRISDEEIWLELKNVTYVCNPITQRETPIPPEYEFIEVLCGTYGSNFKDGFALVNRKASVENRIIKRSTKKSKRRTRRSRYKSSKKARKKHQLSVIMIGLDSTSQMNFIRLMPKSHQYLVNTLSAIQLKGYSKVGENTLPNVVPLLTGLHLSQLKSLCVDQKETLNAAIHLDDCPFIWKNFSKQGYRTIYAEDEVNTGMFNLQWSQAFRTAPTDHYYRTYAVRMQENHASHRGHCQGTRMSFEILMQYIKDAAATYQSDRYFHFTWTSKLSHDDFNRLAWGDNHLLSTLKYLNSNGHLNDTAVFLLGDQGSRNEAVRRTHQGQMEDRLPLAYIILPQRFPSKYPRAWKNLQENSEKLTTAFDIHETLKDLLDLSQLADPSIHYERQTKKRFLSQYGSSLFMRIPESRGCIAAGIPQHWCLCYWKKPILTESYLVKSAARFAVKSFNKVLHPYRKICEPLRLFQVTKALQWKPDDYVRNGKQELAEEEDFKTSTMIQLSFTTLPGPATFEITLQNHPEYGFKLTDEIVRLNRYEGHGNCIHQELKILCHCKNLHSGDSGNITKKPLTKLS